MNRTKILQTVMKLSLVHATLFCALSQISAASATSQAQGDSSRNKPTFNPSPLKPPSGNSIPVAFLVSEAAVMIDFAGPWEVFQDVMIAGRKDHPFQLYTVGESTAPIRASGGMKIIPDYTFENAPAPKIIVIPAQNDPNEATKEWLRKATKNTDVTMSVCTGAFILAKTGLLSGKPATTHHGAFGDLAKQFPDIQVKRGARFVEAGNLATSAGLSSGIDLALHVVERYFGHEVAKQTAFNMEYQGEGWMKPNSNAIYAQAYPQTEGRPVCPVCGMDVDPATAPKSVYKGKTYYFGQQGHKEQFDANPDEFVKADEKR
jgi:putative intracellular protease/amidase/YHS domain-containing protein